MPFLTCSAADVHPICRGPVAGRDVVRPRGRTWGLVREQFAAVPLGAEAVRDPQGTPGRGSRAACANDGRERRWGAWSHLMVRGPTLSDGVAGRRRLQSRASGQSVWLCRPSKVPGCLFGACRRVTSRYSRFCIPSAMRRWPTNELAEGWRAGACWAGLPEDACSAYGCGERRRFAEKGGRFFWGKGLGYSRRVDMINAQF